MPAKQRIVKKISKFNFVEKSLLCSASGSCDNMQVRAYHHVMKSMVDQHVFKIPVCDCSGVATPMTFLNEQTGVRRTEQMEPTLKDVINSQALVDTSAKEQPTDVCEDLCMLWIVFRFVSVNKSVILRSLANIISP